MYYVLNRKSFLVPSVPIKFTSLEEVQSVMWQLAQTLNDLIRAIRIYPDDDLSWLNSSFVITNDKYIY
jgi:hypothetical protein